MDRQAVVIIVSVCFNDREGLIRTIKSIESQDYPYWTHRIQDGCSSDGNQDWVMAHRDERRTLVTERDYGVHDAMNRAAAVNLGDPVWFLNAGDTLADHSVLRQVATHHAKYRWDWAY